MPLQTHLFNSLAAILKDADLESMSSKKVRLQLEEKLGCDLLARKKEIDEIVLAIINQDDEEDEDDDAEDDQDSDYSEEEVKPTKKRASTGGKKSAPAKKKSKYSSEDEDSDGSSDSGSDYKPAKSAKGKKKAKKGSDDEGDSDDDYKMPKAAKKKGAGAGKGNGFTRSMKLSPELGALMGAESLPRHEVVKKMWTIIKSRDLYDPKNKQFAICDDELYKVIGVKRFRTFGMLKYLKSHFFAE